MTLNKSLPERTKTKVDGRQTMRLYVWCFICRHQPNLAKSAKSHQISCIVFLIQNKAITVSAVWDENGTPTPPHPGRFCSTSQKHHTPTRNIKLLCEQCQFFGGKRWVCRPRLIIRMLCYLVIYKFWHVCTDTTVTCPTIACFKFLYF